MNKIVRKLVNTLASLLVPVILKEITYKLEELIKIDINKDGLIGEPKNDIGNENN